MVHMINNIYLTRFVNHKQRYLQICYTKTLFDDIFLVEVMFGAIKNLKPTGIKTYYFDTYEGAIHYFRKYIKQKMVKGYNRTSKLKSFPKGTLCKL